jgi:hypothetical protein
LALGYFGFLVVALPLLGYFEKTKKVPDSIADAVLAKTAAADAALAKTAAK